MVDLCRAVVSQIGRQLNLQSLKTTYVTVTAADRFEAIRQNKADLLCEPTSSTLSRRKLVGFSISTFVDGASLMITPNGPHNLQELAGRTLDAATAERLGVTYTEAKAEIDGVIAGLATVLTQGGGQPTALPDLEQRMAAGFAGRKRFCEEVLAHLPAQEGERSLVSELISGIAKPLIEAVAGLYKYGSETNRLRRDTIRAQVEATRWANYADIAPSR